MHCVRIHALSVFLPASSQDFLKCLAFPASQVMLFTRHFTIYYLHGIFVFQHDTCPVCRKSLNGEDSTRQTQSSEASASNRYSNDSQLHDRWTF